MIDFRYHIVSLISVFLALAVGIVLGAGPLRDYIAESLSGQVEALRAETENLREELELNQTALTNSEDFIDEAATSLVADVLPSYTVSLIVLPGADSQTVNDLGDTLTEAGASVLNIVELQPDFTDPAKRPFRSGIAGNLTEYMDPEPGEDASPEAVIGSALEQALTQYDPADPQQPSQDALSLIDLMRTAELIAVEGDILPTLTFVVVAPDTLVPEEERASELGLVKGMSPDKVVIAGTDLEDSVLREIRTDSDSADLYTTTDSLTTTAGKILVPRALAVVIDGQSGAYGFGPEADGAFPPQVEISEPERVEPEEDQDEPDPESAALAGEPVSVEVLG